MPGLRGALRLQRVWGWFRRRPWIVLAAVLAAIFALAVTLIFVADARSSREGDTWSDISEAGVQVAVITVLGAVVTAAFKYVDERRTRDEQRRRAFHDVLASYNQVKAVRRNLEALGMFRFDSSRRLGAEQARELRAQMAALNEAQLSFETIARELEQSGLFRNLFDIVDQLRTAENYLNKCVVAKWQSNGGEVWEGAGASELAGLELDKFIGGHHDGFAAFENRVSTPLDQITDALHEELFGKPTKRARDAARLRKLARSERERNQTCDE